MKIVRALLFPFSALYALIVWLRNRLYDLGILPSSRASLTTIVVGNLSVGGTGKTPMSVYLITLLQKNGISVGFLSRGYHRASSGFQLPDSDAPARVVGDEPALVHRRFPLIPLAVCEDRLAGIREMKTRFPALQLVVLDDAFQHRRLTGDFNILLTTYQNPFYSDLPLPSGSLRDNRREKRRADVIIMTKCPMDLSAHEMRAVEERINPRPGQTIFFSTLVYDDPRGLDGQPLIIDRDRPVLGFCGLADPAVFRDYLGSRYSLKKFKSYADHHWFTQEDLLGLQQEMAKFAEPSPVLMTTEKDAERLALLQIPDDLLIAIVPVQLKLLNREHEFEQLVISSGGI
jgi:tetraacyldisaccharide 4'-kinase